MSICGDSDPEAYNPGNERNEKKTDFYSQSWNGDASSLEMVTVDDRLGNAARREGFAMIDLTPLD